MQPESTFEPSVTLLGYGNVGYHLALRFQDIGVKIDQIYSRSQVDQKYTESLSEVPIVHNLSDLLPLSTLYIICISDDSLSSFINYLRLAIPMTSMVCHTSGLVNSDILTPHFNNSACLYPFQSFSKDDKNIVWKEIPIFITSHLSRTQERLKTIASRISNRTQIITDAQKSIVHLSGVIANNFTNKLVEEAGDLLINNGIDIDILYPLLDKTISKLKQISPREAQTGPAIRGDKLTMQKHKQMLQDKPKLADVYVQLSQLINSEIKLNK